MAKEEEKKEGEEAAAPKPKSKKKLIIIVAAVLLLAGGGGAFAFMGGGAKPEEEAEHTQEEDKKHLQSVTLDTVIVNLSENASFLKVKMTMEYDPEILATALHAAGEGGHEGPESKLPPGLAEKESMIRDSIIRVLSAKTAAEVLSVDGKEAIKEELIEAVNEAVGLDEGPVINVYFSEFIVQ